MNAKEGVANFINQRRPQVRKSNLGEINFSGFCYMKMQVVVIKGEETSVRSLYLRSFLQSSITKGLS